MINKKVFQKEKQKIDNMLISYVLPYIENADDNDEEHFAFAACQPYIHRYILELDQIGYFNEDYKVNGPSARKTLKEHSGKSMFNIMTVHALSKRKGQVYITVAKLTGPIENYYKAMKKKNIKKYTVGSKLMYLHVRKILRNGDGKTETPCCRVRIHNIAFFCISSYYGFTLFIIGERSIKVFTQQSKFIGGQLIFTFTCQCIHKLFGPCCTKLVKHNTFNV